MSFPVDQCMQVKCKFQLTSETESSESIHSNNERIRLCTSVDLDKNSTLIVMVCSDENGNNHIIAYYLERRLLLHQPKTLISSPTIWHNATDGPSDISTNSSSSSSSSKCSSTITKQHQVTTFAQLASAASSGDKANFGQPTEASGGLFMSPQRGVSEKAAVIKRAKPRIIVKQIYYHNYNEDIVALCLSESGSKLALISVSSTIYILPIKNILLNPHATSNKQLSRNSKFMYFYDASIINCCTLSDPIAIAYWESLESTDKSIVIVGSESGELSFISVEEKKQISSTCVNNERIKSMRIIRDRFSYSLLVTCDSFKQYRFVLELAKQQQQQQQQHEFSGQDLSHNSYLPLNDDFVNLEKEIVPSWERKPIPIKSHNANLLSSGSSAAAAIHRALIPSRRHNSPGSSAASSPGHRSAGGGLFPGLNSRDRCLSLIFYQSASLITSVVDVLGARRTLTSSSSNHSTNSGSRSSLNQPPQATQISAEPRLMRFYSSKQFYYRPQKPMAVCRLTSLDPDELITHCILTDRFLAVATDRDRCLINSRNACNLKSTSAVIQSSLELPPLVKEVTFSNDEKILLLLKSPLANDQDNIIESFLLVTTRSIYSVEARQSCRDMFISLIDSHLGFQPTKQARTSPNEGGRSDCGRIISLPHEALNDSSYEPTQSRPYYEYSMLDDEDTLDGLEKRRRPKDGAFVALTKISQSSHSNLMVNNFLSHRDEVYERISYDSRAFSSLFKLELSSLYEAYGDKLLMRGQFKLANRLFQMAQFSHTRTVGKYIRLGAYQETIVYVSELLGDENEFLDEKERIDLAKVGFECHLAKTIVERSKTLLYKSRIGRENLHRLVSRFKDKLSALRPLPVAGENLNASVTKLSSPITQSFKPGSSGPEEWANWKFSLGSGKLSLYQLCEHSPRCQSAKLSANTIIVDQNDDDDVDESTMTGCTGDAFISGVKRARTADEASSRLECEKALLDFVKNLVPTSLYSFVLGQLVDFDLIDLAKDLTHTEEQIYSLLKILLKARHENRALFRDGRFEGLTHRLELNKEHSGLTKIVPNSSSDPRFLKFITSPEVTKALVKDIRLASQYFNQRQAQYSSIALHQLNLFRKFTISQERQYQKNGYNNNNYHYKSIDSDEERLREISNMTKQEKQCIETIFIEFLTACLDESTLEDSCRLWFNYINFYLNYVGSLEEVEKDLMDLMESDLADFRIATTLYKAIQKSEQNELPGANYNCGQRGQTLSTQDENVAPDGASLESMSKHYSLSNLFTGEFLMKLFNKTVHLDDFTSLMDCLETLST